MAGWREERAWGEVGLRWGGRARATLDRHTALPYTTDCGHPHNREFLVCDSSLPYKVRQNVRLSMETS